MNHFSSVILLVVVVVLIASADGWWSSKKKKVSGNKIASTADKYKGSTKWAKAKYYSAVFRAGSNKCNAFVAKVLEEAGAKVPHRHWYVWSPIGAREWGNPKSSYLTKDKCYKLATSPQKGDIIAGQGHVGIVTGYRTTTSAAEFEVLKNNWGYRSSNHGIIFWRYIC